MRSPSVHALLAAALLFVAVLLRVADPEPVSRLRLSVFDTYLDLSPRALDASLPVRIVDIDDASLARIGQWPWPRTRLAEIVDRLKADGARTITLDLILAEPDRWSASEFAKLFATEPDLAPLIDKAAALPSNDERLAAAIRSAQSIIGLAGETAGDDAPPKPHAHFAIAGDDPLQFVPRFRGTVQSLTLLTDAAKGIGAVNWLPERDQVVRRVPLLLSIAGTLYPSLPLET
ncbi:MAG: CHASE2 domain-containing protein, partial [Hyphomicrobium sp.]